MNSGVECEPSVDEVDWPWYAGGGGAAVRNAGSASKILGLGGKGGGGDGADGAIAAGEDGDPNTGGGGGGGSNDNPAGAGGSGVVIVRIQWANAGPIEKPPATTNFVYTGEAIDWYENVPELYTIDGTAVATNVANYTFTATLQPGRHWGDDPGDTDPVTCNWSITHKPIEVPAKTAASFTYNGTEQRGYETNDVFYTFTGDNVATNAGTYTATASLVDKLNTMWSDGTTADKPLSWTIDKAGVAPPVAKNFTYDGTNKIAADPVEGYQFVAGSVTCATNAGSYEYTVKLDGNHKWSVLPAPSDPLKVTWTIARRPVAKPELIDVPATGVVYDGNDHVVMTNAPAWTFSGSRQTNATNVGSYSFRIVLDPNYCWTGGGTQSFDYSWEIVPQPVPVPTPSTRFCYDREGHRPIDEAPGRRFSLGGDVCKTNAGSYTVTASLDDPDNYVWTTGGNGDLNIGWAVTQRVNRIVGLSIDGWQVGKVPSRPQCSVDGYCLPGEPSYAWATNRFVAESDWNDWRGGAGAPDEAGTYYLRASIAANQNWTSYKAYASFALYNHPSECLSDYVDITLSGYSGSEVLTNYPALVRLSATTAATNGPGTAVNGFDYARAGENGSDLCFTFKLNEREDQILPYEVDTWRTDGESLIWVMIPELRPASGPDGPTTIRLYWAKKPGMAVPANDPKQVWTNFYGVWHMNRISPDNKTETVDSTGRADPARIVSGEITFENGLLGTRATANNNITTVNSALGKIAVLITYDADLNQTVSGSKDGLGSFPILDAFKTVDEARFIDTATPGYSTWRFQGVEKATLSDPNYAVRGVVVREGVQQDYWTVLPSLSTNVWDAGTDTSSTFHLGSLKSGGDITLAYRILPRGTVTNELPTAMGEYAAIFDRAPTPGWTLAGGAYEIPFTILAHAPTPTISEGDLSASGRILLANDDYMNSGNIRQPEVNGQNWYDCPDTYRLYEQFSTFWTFPSSATVTMFNLHQGTEAVLWRNSIVSGEAADKCLWHLQDCRQGNLFPRTDDTAALSANYNFLPWSPTSLRVSNHNALSIRRQDVGWIVMRNVEGAAVTSGCLTNGIGTIYFDAVNFRKNIDADSHRFVVEYVTQEDYSAITNDSEFANADGSSFVYGKLNGKWHRATMVPMICENGAPLRDLGATDEFGPCITVGGTTNNFYRIRATLNVRQPVRFRIRRTSRDTSTGDDGTSGFPGAFIILDNIIVSKPPQEAKLVSPGGEIDLTRLGKTVLGSPCAFSTPFPSITDRGVLGRAKVVWANPPEPTDEVASAKMFYRWRYLNQTQADEMNWKSVKLDPGDGLRSVTPLVYSQQEGDVEFYYTATVRARYFEYCATNDYSGAGLAKPVGDFTEELASVVTRLDSTARLASNGSDWFVRLRNGKSDWEGVDVEVTEGALAGRYPMELVDDNQWRALVPVLANQDGEIRFRFRGENLQVPGEDYTTGVVTVWSPNAREGSTAMTLPDSGRLRESAEGSTVRLDHAAGYLEFKMSDRFFTYTVARAEKQDFNDWNDAQSPKFCVNRNGTNGVDSARMTRYDLSDDLGRWDAFAATNVNWNEDFAAAKYGDPGYPTDIVFVQHRTPANWNANSISFVGKNLVDNSAQDPKIGLAGKVLGQGEGKIEFLASGHMELDGLESVKFRARIGQAADFDMAGVSMGTFRQREHMLFTPLTMSQACKQDGKTLDDMAVGASVSLVECYMPDVGCYEFRISRPYKGAKRTLSLHKWFFSGGVSTNVVLCKREFNGITWTDQAAVAPDTRGYYGALFSFKAEKTGGKIRTRLVCGVTHDAAKLGVDEATPADNYDGLGYDGFRFDDEDSPLTSGSYGVMAKDCPAQFMMPVSFVDALDTEAHNEMTNVRWTVVNKNVGAGVPYKYEYIAYNGGKGGADRRQNALPIPGADDPSVFVDERKFIRWDLDDMADGWTPCYWSMPGMRLERVRRGDISIAAANAWVGFRTPTNLSQTAVLQVRKMGQTGEEDWETVFEREVSSYSLEKNEIEVPLRRPGRWDIRLTTGPDAVDVVFDGIEQRRWNLPSAENSVNQFIYTQARVEGEGDERRLVFEPARVDSAKTDGGQPLYASSLRSPALDGLGHFSFSYEEADANAQVWLQVETNTVRATDLANSYNGSVESVDFVMGAQAPEGVWTTLRKFGPRSAGCDEELGESGTKTVYLGWHMPVQGVVRLFVPTNVVNAAVAEAHRGSPLPSGRTDYGRIVIRSASVTDEPELSDRAWRGWNLRTLGDAGDTEKRMYLPDSTREDGGTGTGLSGALNNTTNMSSLTSQEPWPPADLPLIAASGYPAIWSPTFGVAGGEQRGVGQVTFKARLYATAGSIESRTPGRIVLYGARNSLGTDWRVIQTNEIVSSVFSNFTWSANGEQYSAIKFELTSDDYLHPKPREMDNLARVILDEIVVSEKIQPSIGFAYARPFRQDLATAVPIADILSPAEQPLAGESWGIQTQVSVQQLEDEIDVSKGFRVFFSYYPGKKPWGYAQWKDLPEAVLDEELLQVGEKTNLVFRSTFERTRTLVEPSGTGGSVVQFMLTVKYFDRKGDQKEYSAPLTSALWQQPEWYWPVDLNRENGGDVDASKFSGYTILDTVSPGRAWINEVSWNDGAKAETGGELSTTNQFIEICIPSGVDMKGWYVQATGCAQDPETGRRKTGKIFVFGRWGDPSSKISAAATNGYEFFVIQSPVTSRRGDGGIKGLDGRNAADATWSDATQASLTGGSFSYYQPYEIALYRPSGVLEHQVVLQGTNTSTRSSSYAQYEGTNLVRVLNAEDAAAVGSASPRRFFAGKETSKRKNGLHYASAGVVRGSADGNPAPGAEGTWESGLRFTPGSLNEGQVIPAGWFLPPNGTNSWIYLSVEGGHLYQRVGTNTASSLLVVVPEHGSTNVCYTTDAFYELDCITTDGVTNAAPRHVPCAAAPFVYTIDRPKGTMRIVAHAGLDSRVLSRIDMDKYGDYAPSVVNWLNRNWPSRDADEIVLADYQNANNDAAPKHELGLVDMYWLDIPPFTDSGAKEWTLRAGVTGFSPQTPRWMRGALYTNHVVKVKMYKQHDDPLTAVRTKQKITRLQGLDDSRSDVRSTYAAWRSETFKVRGALSPAGPFLPFRTFVFDAGSFTDDFESTIEIIDPFSTASPGYSYGWSIHPDKRDSNHWRVSVDIDTQPVTVETLKANDTY